MYQFTMKQCNDMHKNLDEGGRKQRRKQKRHSEEKGKKNKFGTWDEGDSRADVLYSRDHGEIS